MAYATNVQFPFKCPNSKTTLVNSRHTRHPEYKSQYSVFRKVVW